MGGRAGLNQGSPGIGIIATSLVPRLHSAKSHLVTLMDAAILIRDLVGVARGIRRLR